MVTTRPVCAPCVRICTVLLRRRQSIILILRPAPGAIALRELFCILGLLCHAAVALRFRDLLHHKISKNGGQKMSYHNDPYRVDYLKIYLRRRLCRQDVPPDGPHRSSRQCGRPVVHRRLRGNLAGCAGWLPRTFERIHDRTR